MQLISYVKTAINKRLLISESHGDSNRCTPCRGKPDQHVTCFPRSVHVWISTIRVSCGLCTTTFHESSTGLDRCTAPDSTSQLSWVAHETHLSFSSNTTIEAVCLSQAPIDNRLLGLLGPYHQHGISTFNTCSRGPTHRSLTDTSGCYNLWGAGLPHHTPRPS
jgi:hypothetical protein